jgi:hypothetical protein
MSATQRRKPANAKTLEQHLRDGTFKLSRHSHLIERDSRDPLQIYLEACRQAEEDACKVDAELWENLETLHVEYASGASYADLARRYAAHYNLPEKAFADRIARWFKRKGWDTRTRDNLHWRSEVSEQDCIAIAAKYGYAEGAKRLGISQGALFQQIKRLGARDQVAAARGRMSNENIQKAASTLGVSVATVQNMRRDGRLPLVFTDEDVERLRVQRLMPKPPKPRKHRRGYADALYSRAAWRRARAECLLRDGNKCVRCGAQTKLVAHHIIEAHLCLDPLDVDNLETLCRRCHGLEHAHRRAIAA